MSFKIGKKSLTRISLVLMLILFLVVLIIIPSSTKSDYSDLRLRLEDPKITDGHWSRKITVYHVDDKVYYNIPVSLTIPEDLIEIELYRYLDSNMMKRVTNDPVYDFQVVDSDGNGLNDIVKWIIPELSEASFSVEGRLVKPETLTTISTTVQKIEEVKELSSDQLQWKEKMEKKGIRASVSESKGPFTPSFSEKKHTATIEKGEIKVEFEDFEDADWSKVVDVGQDVNMNKVNGFLPSNSLKLKDFVWVETNGFLEEGKYKGKIILPSTYRNVFVCEGTKEDPDCFIIQECGERPCYEEINGKTHVLLDHFSGAGGVYSTLYYEGATVLVNGTVVSGTTANLDSDDNIYYNVSADVSTISDVTQVFFDNFETDNFATVWTAGSRWQRGSEASYSPSYAAEYVGNDVDGLLTKTNTVDLASYTQAELNARIMIESGMDSGEYICMDYTCNGGSNWNDDAGGGTALCIDGDVDTEGSFLLVTVDIDSVCGTPLPSNFNVRFRGTSNNAAEEGDVDDVNITASGTSTTAALNVTHNSSAITESISDVVQLNISLKFSSNVTQTYFFDVYNWTDSKWYQMQTGSVGTTDVLWNWLNDSVVSNFIQSTDKVIQVRLRASGSSAFRSQEDLLEFNVSYRESIPPTWSNPNVNVTNPHRGDPVNISTVWQDSHNLAYAWLSTNETGIWKNYTDGTYGSPVVLAGTGPTTVNFTWTNNTGSPRVIGWKIYANDTADNENGTDNPSGIFEGNFTMWGWSNITWTLSTSGSANVGDIVKLVCFVNDTNVTGSGPISGYDVKFYNVTASSSSLLGTNYTNSTGHAVWYWNTSRLPAGTYYPKCNITSNATLYYNSSEYYQANTTITLSNILEITLSQALSNGITFGNVIPNTVGNPARNNTSGPSSGTEYNVTVGSSSTNNIDFYVKLNETFEAGIYVNESSSTSSATSGFTTNTTVDASWSTLGNTTSNCTNIAVNGNCWMKLYFDVASDVSSGYKQRNYTICGVITGNNPSICG